MSSALDNSNNKLTSQGFIHMSYHFPIQTPPEIFNVTLSAILLETQIALLICIEVAQALWINRLNHQDIMFQGLFNEVTLIKRVVNKLDSFFRLKE